MLAGLVLASFTVTPERRAPVLATPTDGASNEPRIAPISRGVIRGLREYDEPDPASAPSPIPLLAPAPGLDTAATTAAATSTEAVEAVADATAEPEPEATPEPTSVAPIVAETEERNQPAAPCVPARLIVLTGGVESPGGGGGGGGGA